jgi:hypothetical protein
VLRVTDEYTIPTVIAVLEATIEALELLRSLLRLVDPGRSVFDDGRGRRRDRRRGPLARLDPRADVTGTVSDVGSAAVTGVERALDELRTALSEADLPEDPESRSIIEDARELSAEIEARVADAERDREGDRRRRREDDRRRRREGGRRARDDGAVRISVDEADGDDGASQGRRGDRGATDDGDPERRPDRVPDRDRRARGDADEERDGDGDGDDPVEIDIDAELESIREEVRGRDEPAADDRDRDDGREDPDDREPGEGGRSRDSSDDGDRAGDPGADDPSDGDPGVDDPTDDSGADRD